MEVIRKQWAIAGVKMPRLVYWNVAARNNLILDDADNKDVTFVSGCSPTIFQSILQGKSSIQLMLEILNSERYEQVK